MPSRKRNQGRARKAKDAESQSRWLAKELSPEVLADGDAGCLHTKFPSALTTDEILSLIKLIDASTTEVVAGAHISVRPVEICGRLFARTIRAGAERIPSF